MITKEQIEKINELYKKQKAGTLTQEEKNEQSYLRKLYVESMKENLRSQLKNIKIVGPEEYEKIKKQNECDCDCCRDSHNHNHEHHHDENCSCQNEEQKN